MAADLVNLINQTKKEVDNLKAIRRTSKASSKQSRKSNKVSPPADRSRYDVYGFSENKSEKLKLNKKRVANDSNSSRKTKVKSKQSNYQPPSGTIDLVSRNER